jgi:hypothetical protein
MNFQGKRKLFRIDNTISLQVGYNLGVFEAVFIVIEEDPIMPQMNCGLL